MYDPVESYSHTHHLDCLISKFSVVVLIEFFSKYIIYGPLFENAVNYILYQFALSADRLHWLDVCFLCPVHRLFSETICQSLR
jgi:hypothetical protein